MADPESLFMPGDPFVTRSLVAQSGELLADSVASVLSGLQGTGLFRRVNGHMEMAMSRLNRKDDPARHRWLASPLLRGWVGRLSAALREKNAENAIARVLDQIPNYFGQSETLAEFPLWYWSNMVEIADPAVRVVIRDQEASTHSGLGQFDAEQLTVMRIKPVGDTPIVVRSDAPSLRLQIDQTAAPQRESAILGDSAPNDDPAFPDYDGSTFDRAALWLSLAWADEHADWLETLQVIVPFQLTGHWSANSFTVSTMQGACWSTQSEPLLAYESLVHEQSHIKLRYIEDSFPLLEQDQPDTVFPVGWRSDRRPIVGIFEGVYVHLHIAHALLRLLETDLLDAQQSSQCRIRLQEIVLHAAEGAAILQRHARWTENGMKFQQWAFDEVHNLRRQI